MSIHEHAYVISVLYCRTLSDGMGAEETDGVTVVELEGGGGDEGEPENGEKDTTVATVDLLAKCKGGRTHRIINSYMYHLSSATVW